MRKILLVLMLNFLLFTVSCSDDEIDAGNNVPDTTVTKDSTDAKPTDSSKAISKFIGVDGIYFVDTLGEPISLRGVAFGNEVWYNGGIPKTHHQKEDYKRVKDMGMNFIRFYMNTETFEDYDNPYTYKEEGWAWLDTNIAWAKEQGIYLNLNVHVPQGGFQSNGDGHALWDEEENQSRFTAFWLNLAKRYKDESTIASYDILNEPGTSETKEQWRVLAQRVIDSIRTVDTNHVVIVERVNSVKNSWAEDEDLNFIEVNDPCNKFAYQYHFYEPIEYTHQSTSWTGIGEGGPYPDKSAIVITNEEWVGDFGSIEIPSGDSDWKQYRGKISSKIKNEKYIVAKPSFMADNIGDGFGYLDNFYIIEYDENGDSIGVVDKGELEESSSFWFWSENGEGKMTLVNDDINGGKKVVSITGCTSIANAGNNSYRLVVTQGHSYQAVAWMKGENIPEKARVGVKIDFEYSPTGVTTLDKDYLESKVDRYINWIHAKGVPAYLGEFGVYKVCFEDNKGGLQWVSDMFDILESRNCAFTYHTYHEDGFGIFYDNSEFPTEDNANTALIELIKEKLK